MSIKVNLLYFASLREQLGCEMESLAIVSGATVGSVRAQLLERGGKWGALADVRRIRAALNQEMCGEEARLGDGDELAFLPPVTGG